MAHDLATAERDYNDRKALRRACAGDREAVLATKVLERWLKRGGDLDLDAVRALVERGLMQHLHVDTDLAPPVRVVGPDREARRGLNIET
ncbi:hypothetical protein H8B02_36335 [Bradyrhizobium sp. Pear77]|uniref:hypothetical protein n=1 Tax=Bradyrhizobium altum TaxID=1571202 RepID=UPI001E5C8C84|nr:hypothetical protein [Bradyrhizobium altum]MCC8958698.1 hypothetical protein [Bradyrhizobium altum]